MAVRLPVVLGSSSKYRAALLAPHVSFTTMSPDIDEKSIRASHGERELSDPAELTLAIARAKAAALLERMQADGAPDSLVITSDQVVVHKGRIREKPENPEMCRQYLHSYSEEPACTVTAVVVTRSTCGRRVEGVDVAKQWFHAMPDAVIDAAIAKGDIMHCAGGFMIDDPLFEAYLGVREGSEDSIIGMPLALTLDLLQRAALD